jgi:hypothetical protein
MFSKLESMWLEIVFGSVQPMSLYGWAERLNSGRKI